MPDYEKMYYLLFNEMSKAIQILQMVERNTEEIYISSPETILKQFSEKALENKISEK